MNQQITIRTNFRYCIVQDCLRFNFFPNSFTAEFNVERFLVRIENYTAAQLDEVVAKSARLVEIAREISKKAKTPNGKSVLFDDNVTGDSETARKTRKRIFPLQKEAFGIFKDLASVDQKCFDFTN